MHELGPSSIGWARGSSALDGWMDGCGKQFANADPCLLFLLEQ